MPAGVALQPSADRPVWLLVVRFAGREYLFASETLEIIDDSDADLGNVPRRFDGQLPDMPWEEALTLFATDAKVPTLSFALHFPDDVAELISGGHDLSLARAEYALHMPGDTWAQRIPLLVGVLDEPEYGDGDEPVRFSVREDLREDQALWPPASATISLIGWPDADPSVVGKCYPWPFGAPGVYTEYDGTAGATSGSPAYLVDTDTLLVAYGEIEAASVTILDATDDLEETFATSVTTDAIGQTVTVVDISGGATITGGTAGNEYWVRFHAGGGALNPERSAAIEGAGELLTFMARRSSLVYDVARFRGLEDYLDRFVLAGCIAEHVSPTRWMRDHLLPILPISIAAGVAGRYPILWRYDELVRDAVEELREGRNFWRTEPVRYDRGELANEITLQFAPRAKARGEYRRWRGVTGRADPESTTISGQRYSDWFTTAHARESLCMLAVADRDAGLDEAWGGVPGLRVLELKSDVIYATTTADLVLQWKAIAHAFPMRIVTGQADLPAGHLTKGHRIAWVDAAQHVNGGRALVAGMTLMRHGVGVQLRVQPDPAHDEVPSP